jgi:hypothetical protein
MKTESSASALHFHMYNPASIIIWDHKGKRYNCRIGAGSCDDVNCFTEAVNGQTVLIVLSTNARYGYAGIQGFSITDKPYPFIPHRYCLKRPVRRFDTEEAGSIFIQGCSELNEATGSKNFFELSALTQVKRLYALVVE